MQHQKTHQHLISRAVASLVALIGINAFATEGGGSIYPHGVENYMAGALPPPGLYGIVYGNSYSASRVNDKDGNDLNIPGFKVNANVLAPRLVWVPGAKLLGGDLVVHAIMPLVNLKVDMAGNSQTKSGLGDMTIGLGAGFHHSPSLHSIAAIDFILPTGGYTKGDLANIGRHYSAFEPVYAISYVDPNGFNGDVKLGYLVNAKNSSTDYKSGQEFHFDYSAGWGVGHGWTVGAGGYVYSQTTSDTSAGVTLDGSKGSAMAVGPSVKYDSGKGWFVTAKWQQEMAVKNRAQGNALWLKVVFPL
ncbi:MAG: transporter [Leptothrix sp. (in: b-proteobacteria)]